MLFKFLSTNSYLLNSLHLPPLRRPGELLAISDNNEKAKILTERFFPQPVLADLSDICQIICILGGVGRARVTCTGYVYRQSLHRAPGARGQSINKIINRSTNFINELLYMHFVTILRAKHR